MKRWIALSLAAILLVSVAAVTLAAPLHIGGGPMLLSVGSPALVSLPPQAGAPLVANPHSAVVGGGAATLRSPLHIGGGPSAE